MQTLADRFNRSYQDFDLSDDTFNHITKVHDWKNHVPQEVIKNWVILQTDERFLIAIVAQDAADREEWD